MGIFMKKYQLHQVFGVHTPPPGEKYPDVTYVDRAGLDARIRYYLNSGRHLVIFGPSKQGKTVLRQRAIEDKDSIVIQCRSSNAKTSIYREVLGRLEVYQETGREVGSGREGSVEANLTGSAGVPMVFKGEAKLAGSATISSEQKTSLRLFGQDVDDLSFVAKAILDSGKKVILEDFHYVTEEDKKGIAEDLKTLLEYGVSLIIVGTWHEQFMLVGYNGDLNGRIDEIDLVWQDEELRRIIELGEQALNIKILPDLVDQIIKDANGSVGLLQRILENYCIEQECYETKKELTNLQDQSKLEEARKKICQQEANRYRLFGWTVPEGFPNSNPATKKIYMRIIQACIEAPELELLAGLTLSSLEEKIVRIDQNANRKSIREALLKIDRLQNEKNINPIIATYNPVTKMFHLADRELLFYRKYGGPKWPWED
jgi:hypothetical protein